MIRCLWFDVLIFVCSFVFDTDIIMIHGFVCDIIVSIHFQCCFANKYASVKLCQVCSNTQSLFSYMFLTVYICGKICKEQYDAAP